MNQEEAEETEMAEPTEDSRKIEKDKSEAFMRGAFYMRQIASKRLGENAARKLDREFERELKELEARAKKSEAENLIRQAMQRADAAEGASAP